MTATQNTPKTLALWAHAPLLSALLILLLSTALPAAIPTTAPTNAAALPTPDQVAAKLPRFDIAGRVLDKSGEPVQGATVILYYGRSAFGLRDRIAGRLQTDATGAFRFEKAGVWEPRLERHPDRSTQRYHVLASHPQHGLEFATLLEGDPATNLTIRLTPAKPYTLKVNDESGKPVPNAHVYLTWATHAGPTTRSSDFDRQRLSLALDTGWISATTSADGQATLLAPGDGATFDIRKDGFAKNRGNARITLTRSSRIAGRVYWQDGTPAPGAVVWLQYRGQSVICSDFALADAQGRYEFPNAPAAGFCFSDTDPASEKGARTSIELTAEDLRQDSTCECKPFTLTLLPGQSITEDLQLTRPSIIAGKVIDLTTNRPAPNVNLFCWIQQENSNATPMVPGGVITDADGAFQVNAPRGSRVYIQWNTSPDGSYIIDTEWRNQGNWTPIQPFQVAGDRLDLVLKIKLLPVQPLTGRVIDENGKPVAGIPVYVHSEVPPATTDNAGNFAVKAVPNSRDFELCACTGLDSSGLFSLFSRKPQGGIARFKAGTTHAQIKLAPAISLEGEVSTSDGLPASDLKFSMAVLINGQMIYAAMPQAMTDADGKCKVARLIPGATYLATWSSDNTQNRDYAGSTALVDLSKLKPGEPFRLSATRYTNALIGRVLNDKGEPIAGAAVDAGYSPLLPPDEGGRRAPVITDAKGEYIIPRLAPGEMTFRVRAPRHKTATFKAPSDSVDYNVSLRPATEPCRYEITLVDGAGQPLRNVPLFLQETRSTAGAAPAATTTEVKTDGSGKAHLEFPVAPEENLPMRIIGCDMEGYTFALATLPGNEDSDIRLIARKGRPTVRGRLVDPAGKPIAGATIRVDTISLDPVNPAYVSFTHLDEREAQRLHLLTTSNPQGEFELTRVAKDMVTQIRITAPGHAALEQSLQPNLPSAQVREDPPETYTLQHAAKLRGRVVVKGTNRPPPGKPSAMIYLRTRNGESSARPTLKDDWTFADDALPPGTCNVYWFPHDAATSKYLLVQQQQVELIAGQTASFTLELTEGLPVKGKLLKKGSTDPVAFGSLMVDMASDPAMRGNAALNGDGTWEAYVPAEGEYRVRYYSAAAQQWSEVKTIKVQRSAPLDPVVIEIDPEVCK